MGHLQTSNDVVLAVASNNRQIFDEMEEKSQQHQLHLQMRGSPAISAQINK